MDMEFRANQLIVHTVDGVGGEVALDFLELARGERVAYCVVVDKSVNGGGGFLVELDLVLYADFLGGVRDDLSRVHVGNDDLAVKVIVEVIFIRLKQLVVEKKRVQYVVVADSRGDDLLCVGKVRKLLLLHAVLFAV